MARSAAGKPGPAPHEASVASRLRVALVAFAPPALALLLHAHRYRDFLADDALISLRYSQRLLQGHGLTWTDGPRVEGYSNLLWILLTAGLGALRIDLVDAARRLGLACSLATVAALGWRAARMPSGTPARAAAALAGGFAVALAGPVGVWSGAGLEGPLVGALLAWAIVLAEPLFADGPAEPRAARAAAVPLALLALARPDGALFAASIALALLIARGPGRETLRLCLALAALTVVAVAGQEVFRIVYYHSWVPNSARVKIAFTQHRLETGLAYFRLALSSFWPLGLLAAAGAVAGLARRASRGVAWLRVVPLLAWTAYVVAIGGDFFPGYRHLLPVATLAAFLVADAVGAAGSLPRWRNLALLVSFALLAFFGARQVADPENARARREVWVWDGRESATMLRAAFGDARPLMAVASAGCFPYWSGFDCIDMLGLNDEFTPRHLPPDFGQGWAGHELGDAAYVLKRAPDIVQFSGIRRSERTGHFRVERELAADPGFRSRYELVTFETAGPRPVTQRLWMSRESPRIGIARGGREVRVPAFLFALNPATRVTAAPDGRPGVEVSSERPAVFRCLALARGRWEVAWEPASAPLIAALRPCGTDGAFAPAGGDGTFALERDAEVDLLLSAAPGSAPHVLNVTLRRVPR
jgi:hypothetical protein